MERKKGTGEMYLLKDERRICEVSGRGRLQALALKLEGGERTPYSDSSIQIHEYPHSPSQRG